MTTLTSLIIIALVGFVHASFQLSVSMLTLLGSHTIGQKKSQLRLSLLSNSFTAGVALMTLLLLSLGGLLVGPLFAGRYDPLLTWTIFCGLMTGLGVAVWLFYYRRQAGTALWVPRSMARYLRERTKATKQSVEAFSLGMTSVIGELLFIFVPILVAAALLVQLSATWQLFGALLYTVVSIGSLVIVNVLIGSGHSISRIQKWRETNKYFLQFAAGSALVLLGFYLYVDQVMNTTAMAAAGSF